MTAAAKKKQPSAIPIMSGKSERPPRILIYGPEGVGKTKLVSGIAGAVFIDCEGGTDRLDVQRVQFDAQGRTRPKKLSEVYRVLEALRTGEHTFKAVVLDGLDELERLVQEHVCAGHTKKGGEPFTSIEDFGYGKGYKMATEEWRRLASELERLRNERKMAPVLVGHAQVKTFYNPEGDDYDRYTVLLHKEAAGFLSGWVDLLGFMNFRDMVAEKPESGKPMGHHTGERQLHLNRSAAFDAKFRGDYSEPLTIPQDDSWAPVRAAIAGESK